MSEVRQRRGELVESEQQSKDEELERLKAELAALKSAKEKEATQATQAMSQAPAPVSTKTEEQQKQEKAEEIIRMLQNAKPKPVKGMSTPAKEGKARLDADPFNLQLILDLGLIYAEDLHWEQCCNVLLRGWKRFHEFEKPELRYALLGCLARASLKTEKYRQALAVMKDIEEPTDEDMRQHYQEMCCQIWAENGDEAKALKAWGVAIEGRTFEQAITSWGHCLQSLRKVGAIAATKSTLANLATSEHDTAQIEAMEKLIDLREEIFKDDEPKDNKMARKAKIIAGSVAFVVLLIILHQFEKSSLSKMNF